MKIIIILIIIIELIIFKKGEKSRYMGKFVTQGENQRSEDTWTWLKERKLKRDTEALIVAAQDQAIRTKIC